MTSNPAPEIPSDNAVPSAQANGTKLEPDAVPPLPEPRVTTRKDSNLRDMLAKMDDYAPIVSCSQDNLHVFPNALYVALDVDIC